MRIAPKTANKTFKCWLSCSPNLLFPFQHNLFLWSVPLIPISQFLVHLEIPVLISILSSLTSNFPRGTCYHWSAFLIQLFRHNSVRYCPEQYRVPLLSILQCHYIDGSREPSACFKTLLIWAVIHHKDPSSAGYQRSALSCYVGSKEFTFYTLTADFMAIVIMQSPFSTFHRPPFFQKYNAVSSISSIDFKSLIPNV